MQLLLILFGAAFTCAVCLSLGGLLLGDACRDPGVRFVSGGALLSLLVCALCGAGLAYPLVLLGIGVAVLVLHAVQPVGRKTVAQCVSTGSTTDQPQPRDGAEQPAPLTPRSGAGERRGPATHGWRRGLLSAALRALHAGPLAGARHAGETACATKAQQFTAMGILWSIAFGMFAVLYLANAMAPEISPDGSAYHLGLVSHYLREHGFVPITDNLYAAMPGGMEMLFLFAFAFGRHSAAAMVHLAFFVALVWQVFSYARRRGFPVAGASAALIVFASPVAGIDGSSAYNDVAVAAIAFTLFHLLQIWDEERDPRLLAAIGLVAGFAFATKYTAWPAVAYAVCFVAVRDRKALGRAALPVAACAALVIAPWLLKNWIYLHNPLAPFFNRQFPNPYVMAGFEDIYRRMMAIYQLRSRWEIPMQVTTYGSLSGLLGPVFLLAPLGLVALRRKEGRQLWLAALIFSLNYFSNIAARFLIPPLPMLAHDFVAAADGLLQHGLQDFVRGVALIERLNQRLHDGDGPIKGAAVAPSLQEVALRDVPVGVRRRLIEVLTVMDHHLHFREVLRKGEIGGRGEYRVPAKDDKNTHRALFHFPHQLPERIQLPDRARFRALRIEYSLTGVPERFVHSMRQGVHLGRLPLSSDDDARALVLAQVCGNQIHPAGHIGRQRPAWRRCLDPNSAGDFASHRHHVGRRERQAVV